MVTTPVTTPHHTDNVTCTLPSVSSPVSFPIVSTFPSPSFFQVLYLDVPSTSYLLSFTSSSHARLYIQVPYLGGMDVDH